jgi:protein-tyrosine phosphatase
MLGFTWAVDHMNCILPPDPTTSTGGLWVGNWQAAKDIPTLLQNNIKFILTALPAYIAANPQYEPYQITQKICESEDIPSFDLSPFFEEAFAFIDSSLTKGNVLIHCAAGVSRSSTLTCVYLMKKYNKTF